MISFKQLFPLLRVVLSLGVSFSALSVYVYYRHAVDTNALFLFAGVFLLSCAASALNQYQEREADALMERTRYRPVPMKMVTFAQIVTIAIITGAAGLSLLYFGTNPVAALIGAVAIFVYNAVYTPCKTRSPFALFPGAIAGALPVLIGCAAAGGRIDEKAFGIALFAFFWQIPHFLLLSIRFADDYRRAGIPTLLSYVSPERIRIIAGIWSLAASAVTVMFPILGIMRSVSLITVIVIMNLIVAAGFLRSLHRNYEVISGRALYAFQGMVFVLLMVQGMVGEG